MLIAISGDQLLSLQQRYRQTLVTDDIDLDPVWEVHREIDSGESVLFDPVASLDDFVGRCVGTMLEFEAMQRAGGAVLLGYPDGSVRQITLNLDRDGYHLNARPWEAKVRRGWKKKS